MTAALTADSESLDLEQVIVGVLKTGCDLDTDAGRAEFVRRYLSDSERELATWIAEGATVHEMACWLRVNVRTVSRRIVALELKLSDYNLSIRVIEGPPQRSIRNYYPRFGWSRTSRLRVRHFGGFRRLF